MEAQPAAEPVKLIAALLWNDPGARDRALEALERAWGPIDHRGDLRPFASTSYYFGEMGTSLEKALFGFERLVPPESLGERKLEASAVELALRGAQGRRVNIDPGYLDHHKLVLASFKAGPQKIAVAPGVFADPVLRYSRGAFHPFEWTFDDYRSGEHSGDLLALRDLYVKALRARRG